VQASAAGLAIALGGVIRDVVAGLPMQQAFGPATSYNVVYGLEIVLLLAAVGVMIPLLRRSPQAVAVAQTSV
jgi:BCD family chlorophyll transporter-like MFS transporter